MSNDVFGFVRLEDSPGFLLWQTTITWQRLIKKVLEPYALSHAQFVILALSLWLENNEHETSQSQIIRLSKLDKMTVSKALKKLVESGYVKREEHQHDTRAKNIYLTKKGKEIISKLIPKVEAMDEQFFQALKINEQKTLIKLLGKLVADINSSSADE